MLLVLSLRSILDICSGFQVWFNFPQFQAAWPLTTGDPLIPTWGSYLQADRRSGQGRTWCWPAGLRFPTLSSSNISSGSILGVRTFPRTTGEGTVSFSQTAPKTSEHFYILASRPKISSLELSASYFHIIVIFGRWGKFTHNFLHW